MTDTTNAGPEPMFTATLYGSAEAAREAEVKWLRGRVAELEREREALIAELDAATEQGAPLPPDYKVEEFIPSIWCWSAKGEFEWAGDGSHWASYEAAVVAAWKDHADTLNSALEESTASEIAAQADRDRLRAENEALFSELLKHVTAAVRLVNGIVQTRSLDCVDNMVAANMSARDLMAKIDAARAARETK
jgi:hypothetical protein